MKPFQKLTTFVALVLLASKEAVALPTTEVAGDQARRDVDYYYPGYYYPGGNSASNNNAQAGNQFSGGYGNNTQTNN